MDKTATCPQCGRTIRVYQCRFGDWCYGRHMMAAEYDNSLDIHAEFGPTVDRDRASLREVTCPMSGQVVENEK